MAKANVGAISVRTLINTCKCGGKPLFNHNTIALEIVTPRSNHGAAWFDSGRSSAKKLRNAPAVPARAAAVRPAPTGMEQISYPHR
jgi:hypothetical protein